MKPSILVIAAVIVAGLAGAGGFVAGMAVEQPRFARFGGAPLLSPNGQAAPQQGQGAPVANGQVQAVNGNTLQILTADSVVTVQVNNDTIVNETIGGSIADLQPGTHVTIFSADTGDNPTASRIQIMPNIGVPGQP